MTIKQLRAILNRYGAAGVLFVGGYMSARHAWQRRRAACIAVMVMFPVMSVGLLWHLLSASPPAKHVYAALGTRPTPPAPAPVPARLHLSLQDDTQPGPPVSPYCFDRPVHNGRVVFNAVYYHKSGQFYRYNYMGDHSGDKEETLAGDEENETSHIYCINADGSRRRQLTWGASSDSAPLLSPDGKRVVFVRSSGKRDALCRVSIEGGPVHTLRLLPHSLYRDDLRRDMSPDGKWIALSKSDASNDLLLLSLADGRRQIVADVEEIAWSPDGRLYARDANDHARIFRPGSAAFTPVRNAVRHAVWLNDHTLAGDSSSKNEDNGREDDGNLHIINDHGMDIRHKELQLIGKENDYKTFSDRHIWYALPQHPDTLILNTSRHMSDGAHSGCYRVDIRTGKARLLEDGSLIGIAPDGSQVAVADQAWVGPYKRGGRRVGPLKIVTLASGRSHAITNPLTCIDAGDWQAASADAPAVASTALLRAVEHNDERQARSLLARGVGANAHYGDGTTALMIAASEGHVDMVRLLLRYHALPNRADKTGETALMASVGGQKAADEVETGHEVVIAGMLVQAGASLNARDHAGRTALMEAAANGRAVVADLLLWQGAQVNAHDNDGWTALMFAAHNGYAHTTQTLLDHAAAVNLRNKYKDTALTLYDESMTLADKSPTTTLLQQAGATE